MVEINIKDERKVLDSVIVFVSVFSAYAAGFIQLLGLGAITFTLTLPTVFLIVLAFLHLVIRTSRKFDRAEHRISYQAVKTVVFTGMAYFWYQSGLSTGGSLIPQFNKTFLIALGFTAASLYLMAYLANN